MGRAYISFEFKVQFRKVGDYPKLNRGILYIICNFKR